MAPNPLPAMRLTIQYKDASGSLGFDQLYVPERSLSLFHLLSHTFVALTPEADRPVDRRCGADPLLPLRRDLAEIVDEYVSGTGTVGAVVRRRV